MVDYQDFGVKVRSLRRQKGMTQETLAEKAGISTSFLGHIERGSRIASLDTLVAICNALLVPPQHLLSASLNPQIMHDLPINLTSEECHKLSDYLRLTGDSLAARSSDEDE